MCAASHLAPADRRASPRWGVLEHELIPVDLRCDNGGIVLNCSQGGMAIQAVAPPPQGPGHELLVYLPDVPKPIVAIGSIVWVNEFHQAGICFTALPDISRTRFAEWVEQTAQTQPACAGTMATLPGPPAWHEPFVTQGLLPHPASPHLLLHADPSAGHSTPPQGANQVSVIEDDPEPWGTAFAAAGVVSLVLMLLCSLVLRRTTSVPSLPTQGRPPASAQQTQSSVPVTPTCPPASVQTLTASPPQPPPLSLTKPHPAPRPSTTRPHSRQVRRDQQGDDDDEVIVRHFTRPALPAAAQEQQTPPPR